MGSPRGLRWTDRFHTKEKQAMDLGAFSVSLAVKDLAASRDFYEALGFTAFMGDPSVARW